MNLNPQMVGTLPPMAWCARVRRSSETVELIHGSGVETLENFFCEGAWAGPFASGDFDQATFAGSGGRLLRDEIIIASPTHTLERLFLCEAADSVVISNSLVFLLAQLGDKPDLTCQFYASRLASIIDGINDYQRCLKSKAGRRIRILCHGNLRITRNLVLTEVPKAPAPDFKDFSEYRNHLETQIKLIQENAVAPQRRRQYLALSTISSGYDSPAVAVLGKSAGCFEALTFRQGREKGSSGGCDSGEEIARHLGIKITAFERNDFLKLNGYPEAENFGCPLVISPWSEKLNGRLLLTGYHGDTVWDKDCDYVSRTNLRRSHGGTTFSEFRLRSGFIHLPVPFIGSTSHPSIDRISKSSEMQPWMLGNDYDRPIARRLVEEAGVPRHLFGVQKNAVDVYLTLEGLHKVMTPESLRDFQQYLAMSWTPAMTLKSKLVGMLRQFHRLNRWINRQIQPVLRKLLGRQVLLPYLLPARLRVLTYHYIGRESLLFHWSVDKLLPRYQISDSVFSGKNQPDPSRSAASAVNVAS